MSLSDKALGCAGLVLSITGLVYLFLRLLIVPLLPLDDDHPLNLIPPITILLILGLSGLLFLGTLSAYTLYMLYKHKFTPNNVKID